MNISRVIILILWAITFQCSLANKSDLRFNHLTIDQGLSNNYVTSILKDAQGFIWIGTSDGLNRYDGYDFQLINSYGEGDLKLSNNIINCLFEDSDGCLWIGTMGGGLNRLDNARSTVTHFEYDTLKNSISSNHVFKIVEDKSGAIWIATGGGLNKFDRRNGQFSHFNEADGLGHDNLVSMELDEDKLWIGTYGGGINIFNTKNNEISTLITPSGIIDSDLVWDIFKDSDGLIWIATEKEGLCYYNPKTKSYRYFLQKEGAYNFLNNNFPVNITEDEKKRIWISTDQGGLYCYTKEDDKFKNIVNNPYLIESIKTNALTRLLIDDNNMLWVGTYDKGVSFTNLNQENIIHITHQVDDRSSLSNKSVNCIYEDSDGDIWIGTENGLNKVDTDFNVIQKYDLSNGLSDNVALSVLEVDNELWIGTYTGGISVFNKETGQFRYLNKASANDESRLTSDFVRVLFKDSHGLIWIGTVRGGVDVYNPATGKITNYPNTYPEGAYLNSSNVMSIYEDEESNIWLMTYGGGINKFDRASQSFSYYMHSKENKSSLSSNQAICQLFDSRGNYWVGTNFGLNRLNADRQSFTSFYMEDGLVSNAVVGLVEDNDGNLWITTQNGLSLYNLETGIFSNYYREDGLQENVFHYNAITRLKNNDIVCGGINGINVFKADVKLEVRQPFPVIITGLSVFNKQVNFGTEIDGREIYEGHLSETNAINLSYKDKLFELTYSTLEYRNAKQTSYQYKIDELHDEWINLGSKNHISFHNLTPDNYTFRIKSIITNGKLESEETVLAINIAPPFYTTYWFYVLMVVLFVSLVVAFYFIKNRSARRQRAILQQKVAEKTKELWLANEKLEKHKGNLEQLINERTKDLKAAKEKAEKADALKTAFLANMSHEIRTPMNAILGFIDLLNEAELSIEDSTYFKGLIQSNSITLMRLIDDIMDLARIESGDIFIKKTRFEITAEVEKICAIYHGENNDLKEGVEFICNRIEQPIEVYTDPVRLKQIITNLINNAIKFTEKGSITFNYSIESGRMSCYVRDTGIGIPQKEIGNIFNRFNKLEGYSEKVYRGTGLGLAITKELIRLLGGHIYVESKQGEGSTFYFDIDLTEN